MKEKKGPTASMRKDQLQKRLKRKDSALERMKRELKIEAALEKVRARTMAMEKSDELPEAAIILFQQIKSLGVQTGSCGFNIWAKDEKAATAWMSSAEGALQDPFKLPHTVSEIYKQVYRAMKNGEDFLVKEVGGKTLKKHFDYLLTVPGIGDVIKRLKETGYVFPETMVYHFAFFNNGYLSFHLHEHRPDAHNIFKRFAKVFEQTYTRFLDLQKAEAQAREAQIELSLERVRAKTMAMHNSQHVADTVAVMFDELVKLGIDKTTRSGVAIIGDKDDMELWTASSYVNGEIGLDIGRVDLNIHQLIKGFRDAWRSKKSDYFYELIGEDLKDYFKAINASPDYPTQFDLASLPSKQIHSSFFFPEGAIYAFSLKPLTAEAAKIFKRFAGVFGQTYRRYLDLKKAEAQAREAQIEAALERVRSRTMAMFKSDELAETAAVLFHQLIGLGIMPNRLFIGIINNESGDIEAWATIEEGDTVSRQFVLSSHRNHSIKKMYDGWKTKKKSIIIDMHGKELENYFHYLNDEMHVPFSIGLDQKRRVQHIAYFSKGFIGMTAPDEQPAITINLLERFASVFNLTYTRFTDLQKAEAQAREAQIEASLERVRSRAMSMYKTDELLDAAELVYNELSALGFASMSVNYAFVDDKEKNASYYSVNPVDGKILSFPFIFPHTETDVMRAILAGWKKQEPFNLIELDEEATLKQQTYIGEIVLETMKKNNINIPFSVETFFAISLKRAAIYTFNFSKGYLFIIGGARLTKSQEEMALRFTKVFEMTYRRFLDLKLAEAQAREARIEAALEKVSGKAMAMRNSEDLSFAASMVFTELRKLGINPIRSGVGVISKESRQVQFYSAMSSASGDSLSLTGGVAMSGHPEFEKQYESWVRKENHFLVLKGEELKSYNKFLFTGLNIDSEINVENDQEHYGHWLMFSEGFLFAWSDKAYSETEINILERFKKIVELTFRRYFELKKSELNAKEAVKQAALDRVRADISSMRTANDLEKITPLIWNELTVLGLPFIRCGVFIMDDELEQIHTFLSAPDGKAIAAFHIPYDTPGNINQVLNHWRQKENYVDYWDEKAFADFAETLVKQGALASSEQYLQTIPHGGFHLHFLPFLQGMLYVGNSARLGEEEINLIQSVADAFSTAYARYEDFNKLEVAKQTVEKALVDLKQAQQQLVQSEKMASLGELTAGIAHEIQNPLNFVKNFSEVSNELIDELLEERRKAEGIRDGQFEDQLLNDIKQNLEKINHHGKRADGIVKGMLQHSRSSGGQKELTDINVLTDEYIRLCFHGLRAKDKSFNSTINTDFDHAIEKINIIPQDIGRVMLNLLTNAFYAVNEKNKLNIDGYEPTVSVSTKELDNQISIRVIDNGNGIPKKIVDKIFQPFFTTKPTGQGTGLGLSLSYDIIKAHSGEIKVETKEGEGTGFFIQLPITH